MKARMILGTLTIFVLTFGLIGNGIQGADCRHTGQFPFSGPWEVWREQAIYSIGDRVVSSPVLYDNKVLVATLNGELLCLEGGPRLLWIVKLEGRILCSPWADPWNGDIYVGTTTGQFYRIESNGNIVAQEMFDTAIVSGAVSDENYVYFGDWDGSVHCVTKKLEPVWSYSTGYTINSAPSLTSTGNVIATSMDGFIYCLSSCGELLWRFDTGDAIFGSSTINKEDNIYVGSHNGMLYALDPEGRLRWSFRCLNQIVCTPALDEQGNIYFGSDDGFFYVLNSDGTLRWKYKRPCGFLAPPILDTSGDIYWVSCNAVERRSAQDGHLINGYAMPRGESLFSAEPVISEEGHLWVVSAQGIVHVLGENRNAFVVRESHDCDMMVDDFEHGVLRPLVGGSYTFDSDERHHTGMDRDSYCTFSISTAADGGHFLMVEYQHRRWLKAIISLPRLDASGYDGLEFTMWSLSPTTVNLELGVFSPSGEWSGFTIRGIYLDKRPKRYRVEFASFAEGWSDNITGIPLLHLRNLVAIGFFPQSELGKLFLDDVCLDK